MSNKTILQENNTKLSTNNTSLGTILQTINNLPNKDVVQSKSVTITQNGTTIVTPDTGYDTMDEVTITTQVGQPTYQYVQDGLIAWYEGEDDFDSNEHLNSRVGSDYLYVIARQTGDSTSLPMANYGGYTLFQNNFVLASSTDYYKTGYTIELVGFLEGINGWLITGNVSQTAGIGSQGSYKLAFQNDQDVVSSSPYYYTSNKLFSASVIFTDIGTSRGNTYAYKTKGSVNGSTYLAQTARSYTHSQNSSGAHTIIGGYYGNGQYRHFGGIKSIRVYNRELTEAEKNYNYGIDAQRFNLED